jgi:hypothetical protein
VHSSRSSGKVVLLKELLLLLMLAWRKTRDVEGQGGSLVFELVLEFREHRSTRCLGVVRWWVVDGRERDGKEEGQAGRLHKSGEGR